MSWEYVFPRRVSKNRYNPFKPARLTQTHDPGEEHVFNTILSQRLGWRLDPKDPPKLLETYRKLARRSRLQRECRTKYGTNILEHYTRDEAHALKIVQRLRLAASGIERTDGRYDDVLYTKQDILNELPDDAIIHSGNSDPGPKPASVPRGIITDQDYCRPGNRERGLPPPSAADLFSPRPLPELSIGRTHITEPQEIKREKRSREGDSQRISDNLQNFLWVDLFLEPRCTQRLRSLKSFQPTANL